MKQMTAAACAMLVGICLTSTAMAGAFTFNGNSGRCPLQERPLDHLYEIGVGYLPESQFEGGGESAIVEVDVDWPFGYLENVGGCNMDFNFVFRDALFTDSAEINLPDQVGLLALDSGFTWETQGGFAVQLRARPGLYSDFANVNLDGFYFPVSCCLAKDFGSGFSGVIGAEVRPDFGQELMPIIGIDWQVSDAFRLDLGLPRSQVTGFINESICTYLAFAWQNMSYDLAAEEEGGRSQVTLEDLRVLVGTRVKVTDPLQVRVEFGTVFDRSVEFDRYPSNEITVEDELFFRLAIGAPL